MEFEILNTKTNPFFSRTELQGKVSGTTTATRAAVVDHLKKTFNSEYIIVQNIKTQYGTSISHFNARVYKDEKEMKSIEQRHMLLRFGYDVSDQFKEKEPRRTRKDNRKKRQRTFGTERAMLKKQAKKDAKQ